MKPKGIQNTQKSQNLRKKSHFGNPDFPASGNWGEWCWHDLSVPAPSLSLYLTNFRIFLDKIIVSKIYSNLPHTTFLLTCLRTRNKSYLTLIFIVPFLFIGGHLPAIMSDAGDRWVGLAMWHKSLSNAMYILKNVSFLCIESSKWFTAKVKNYSP